MRKCKLFRLLAIMGLIIVGATYSVAGQEKYGALLHVGSKMPDLLFHTMVNYPGGKARLSDFAGKPVILDLWHVQCGACIQGMPKMQLLQRKFGNEIQIIALGMNNISDYKKLKKTSSILRDITTLPLALQADTLFIHNLADSYPTHVWIDREGIIRAITNSVNSTEKHIQEFIDGKALDFIMQKPKNSIQRMYPNDTSMLVQGNGQNLKNLAYHSLFTGRLDYGEASEINEGPIRPGIKIINSTLMDFLIHWRNDETAQHAKLVFETEDLKKYLLPNDDDSYDEWRKSNTYCYELSLPESVTYTRDYVLACMKEDVQRFFRVDIKINKQLTNCLVLYRLDSVDRIKTKGGAGFLKDYKSNGYNKGTLYTNFPMKTVIEQVEADLSRRQEPVKIIDETNYKFNVDIKFDTKLDDVNLVRAGFKKYGLGLKEEQRIVDCIVVSNARL